MPSKPRGNSSGAARDTVAGAVFRTAAPSLDEVRAGPRELLAAMSGG